MHSSLPLWKIRRRNSRYSDRVVFKWVSLTRISYATKKWGLKAGRNYGFSFEAERVHRWSSHFREQPQREIRITLLGSAQFACHQLLSSGLSSAIGRRLDIVVALEGLRIVNNYIE
jgi:hypothetical protein